MNPYDLYLKQYNFNLELNVKAVTFGEKVTIEFTLPNNKISDKIKNDLQNQDFKKGDQSVVLLKKKTRSTFEIRNGNSFEIKVKTLLFILKNYLVDDRPIFEAEFIPLPANISTPIFEMPPSYNDKFSIKNDRKKIYLEGVNDQKNDFNIGQISKTNDHIEEMMNKTTTIEQENHQLEHFNKTKMSSNYDLYLKQYNFNLELNVKAVTFGEKVTIEFTLPNNKISDKIKNDLQNQDFKKGDQSVVLLKKKTRSTFEIRNGNSFEIKVKTLLFILKNYLVDDRPIFEAEFIPLPANISTPIFEMPPKYFDISAFLRTNKKEFNKFTTPLTTEQVYLLVSMYDPDELHNLVGLVQDKNHDPQIFNLKIPNPVNVLIEYVGFDKYQISFGGNNSNLIRDTIIDKALKTIESTECILATFTETDPIDTDELKQILNNPNVVVSIPDENTIERDSKITYVEIFIPFLNDEIFNDIISKLDDYFYKVNLAVCKKCTLFFSPNSDDPCYKLFHKGQQIPFESGEMEEIMYDEEGPYITVNYTCCGEVPKDEIPINCGKEENGLHEIDEKFGIISRLKITKTKPGRIKQSEIEYKHKFS